MELTNLESLVLDSGAWLAEGYDMCTQLSSLRSLQLNCVAALPSCLSSLTGLERLAVVSRVGLYAMAVCNSLGTHPREDRGGAHTPASPLHLCPWAGSPPVMSLCRRQH